MPTPEEDKLYALLALIADPAAAKDRLDKLIAERTAAEELHGVATKALQDAADHHAAADQSVSDAHSLQQTHLEADAGRAAALTTQANALTDRVNELSARETDVVARQARIDSREAALDARHADFEGSMRVRETDLKKREDDVAALEATTRAAAEQATALKKSLESKAALVQAALAT